jgi:RNA polymerase sigma-70 factor (ECF subfamily)
MGDLSESKSVELVNRWQEGDQDAATELFHRYAERLISLAHRKLSAQLAQRIQPEDVVQSVYCSFFVGARKGRYVLEHSGDLWRLLVTITLNKLHHQYKRHTAGKRSVGLEGPTVNSTHQFRGPADVLSREPSPAEATALVDVLDQVLRALSPVQRRMVELRLEGYNLEEIAAMTEHCRQTVRRTLDRVQLLLAPARPE